MAEDQDYLAGAEVPAEGMAGVMAALPEDRVLVWGAECGGECGDGNPVTMCEGCFAAWEAERAAAGWWNPILAEGG